MTLLIDELGTTTRYAVDRTFVGGLAPEQVLDGVEFEGCTFAGGVFERARLTGCVFEDCVFDGCNLALATLVDSRFVGCRFVACKALAVNWASATISVMAPVPIVFERCQLDYGAFVGMDLRGSRFVGSSLREADFSGATLRGADFEGADLSLAVFAGADVRDASLIDAHGYAFDIREVKVKGLRISADGAVNLLAPLGISVI